MADGGNRRGGDVGTHRARREREGVNTRMKDGSVTAVEESSPPGLRAAKRVREWYKISTLWELLGRS